MKLPRSCFSSSTGGKQKKKDCFCFGIGFIFGLFVDLGACYKPVRREESAEICRTRLFILPLEPVRHTYWGESPVHMMGIFPT